MKRWWILIFGDLQIPAGKLKMSTGISRLNIINSYFSSLNCLSHVGDILIRVRIEWQSTHFNSNIKIYSIEDYVRSPREETSWLLTLKWCELINFSAYLEQSKQKQQVIF